MYEANIAHASLKLVHAEDLHGATTYDQHKHKGGIPFLDVTPVLQKAARVLRFLTRIELADPHNIIPANILLWLHKPQVYEANWADYF